MRDEYVHALLNSSGFYTGISASKMSIKERAFDQAETLLMLKISNFLIPKSSHYSRRCSQTFYVNFCLSLAENYQSFLQYSSILVAKNLTILAQKTTIKTHRKVF